MSVPDLPNHARQPSASTAAAAPLRLDPDTNFSIEQFAALTDMTPDEVLQRIYKKRVPAVRGFKKGQWLIPADLVRAWLEQRKALLLRTPGDRAPAENKPNTRGLAQRTRDERPPASRGDGHG